MVAKLCVNVAQATHAAITVFVIFVIIDDENTSNETTIRIFCCETAMQQVALHL
jgi:hypothetical protein